jgi:hypothetical protein
MYYSIVKLIPTLKGDGIRQLSVISHQSQGGYLGHLSCWSGFFDDYEKIIILLSLSATVYTQVIELPKNIEKPHPGSATQNLSLSLVRRGKDLPLGKARVRF